MPGVHPIVSGFVGIFGRGEWYSPDPLTLLANELRGIRSWLCPEVKQSLDGKRLLTFRTRPGGGWIVTNNVHGWTGMKADVNEDGHFIPTVEATPIFLRTERAASPELAALLMALCGEDLTGYVKAHAEGKETGPDADRNAAWAESEMQALRNEGRLA